jgi:hypothetical protein
MSKPSAGDDAGQEDIYDTIVSDAVIHRDMIAMKKISEANISYCVERRDWEAGTFYSEYNHNVTPVTSGDSDLWSSNFYVFNTDNNIVYVCISNNGGTPSTVKPNLGLINENKLYSDDYIWKAIYTIDIADREKFLTAGYMPVINHQSSQVTQGPSGGIEHIIIKNGGTGYIPGAHLCNIVGDGSGGTATANITVSAIGEITEIVITNKGSGYTFADLDLANTTIGSNGSGSDIEVVISPDPGYGVDNIKLLAAPFLMISTSFDGNEGDKFPTETGGVEFSFAQVGLIKNPTNYGSNILLTTNEISCLKTLSLTGVSSTNMSDIKPGDIISNASIGSNTNTTSPTSAYAEGVAVQSIHGGSTTGEIKYFQQAVIDKGLNANLKIGDFQLNDGIYDKNGDTTAIGTIDDIIPEEYDRYSGEILYAGNHDNMGRNNTQKEEVRILFKF